MADVPEDLKSRLAKSYDTIATRYNEWTVTSHDTRRQHLDLLLPRLLSTSKPKVSVLELGCGAGVPGTLALLQSSPKIHVTGNDISSTQLSLLRTNLTNTDPSYSERVTVVESDMMALKFPPNSFDAVLGFYSILHLPREEQTELLKRIKEWLCPGGYLLANFAAEEAARIESQEWLGEKEGWMYWSGWGEEKMRDVVKDVGLEVLEWSVKEDIVDAEFLWVLAKR